MPNQLADPGAETPSAEDLIACVEAYFASADSFDISETLAVMTPDCVLEYLTDDRRYEGRDEGIKAYFEQRAKTFDTAWHGTFFHVADPARGCVATRFDVRRKLKDGATEIRDNINLFEFEGRLVKRISVWRSLLKAPA